MNEREHKRIHMEESINAFGFGSCFITLSLVLFMAMFIAVVVPGVIWAWRDIGCPDYVCTIPGMKWEVEFCKFIGAQCW